MARRRRGSRVSEGDAETPTRGLTCIRITVPTRNTQLVAILCHRDDHLTRVHPVTCMEMRPSLLFCVRW